MPTSHRKGLIHQLRTAALLGDGSYLTDEQLLTGFLERQDEVAFEALVRRHGPMVLGVCRRVLGHQHDAEDAFQATFLVLVRKAASIVPGCMLPNWLYGVAYKTALKAKAKADKRRARERQVTELPDVVMPQQPEYWQDVRRVLDQELTCLPDKYRCPIVLCDLEGKTRKEAARQLGWPEGTVASRLAKARALLAKRLMAHGLAPSASALALLLPQNGSACVSRGLITSTVQAACLYTSGQAVPAGAVSASVVALAQGVMKTMFVSKVKIGVVFVLALATGSFGIVGLVNTVVQARDENTPMGSVQQPQRAENGPGRLVPASAGPGRIFLSTTLQIMEGDQAKEKLDNRIIAIDPQTGAWQELSSRIVRTVPVPILNSAPGNPRVSPDGRTIAFGLWQAGIWTCEAAGGGNLKQLFGKGSTAVWGPDSKELIVTQETLQGRKWKFESWLVAADGSNAKALPLPATDGVSDWSPDGKWLATISGRPQPFPVNGLQVYIMRLDGKEERLLPHGGANVGPRFSPDSKAILYHGYEKGSYKAWTVPIHDGQRSEVYRQEKQEIGTPGAGCWSPDGRHIALVVHDWERSPDGKLSLGGDPEKANYRIVLMDTQGRQRKELKLKGARIIGCNDLDWR